MKLRQVNSFVVFAKLLDVLVQILDDNLFVQGNFGERLDHHVPLHLEDLLALFHQWFIGVVDMAFLGQLIEDIEDSCFSPQLRVFGESQFFCDAICGDEANAEYLCGQGVRVLLDHLNGLPAVALEDLGGIT